MIDKFVFDTNALISAHLLQHSISRLAFDRARTLGIIVSSAETFLEFKTTFIRTKFDKYISLHARLDTLREFEEETLMLPIKTAVTACRDPNNNKFLELAVAANASCIITGDRDLLILHPFQNIPILNAADFVNNFYTS
ncbi:MAG: putative toxin-antitoxin system toxin component, PIN family [Bacteroidetes bacterium]|nr:putative toxin-antitoxin system toxin component, PIN family [Bacteroidota bacterium]